MRFVRFARGVSFALIAGMAATGASAESLSTALASAYTNNPDILAANLAAQAAAEGIVSAKAGVLPNLAFTGGLTETATISSGSVTDSLTGNIGLGYSQTLFDNGATQAKVESARASTDAAMESARNTEQSVLLSAAEAYYSVAINQKIVELRQDSVNYFEAQVQAAKDRLDVGEGTQTDVAQAQAQLASSLADQQSAVANLAVAEANFVRYVGRTPRGITFDFPFEHKLPTSLDTALALAEAHHPGLLAAEAAVRGAKADTEAAQAAFGPTFAASGSLGTSITYGTGAGTGTPATSAKIGVTFTVPLYAGGALGANSRMKNLTQIKAEMTAQATHDLIVASIAQAWSSLRTSAATIAAVQAAENATQRVLDAVAEEFGVGQKTQLDVLNARSDLTSVQISRIQAESGRLTAALSLLSAIGGMSAANLGLPVEIRTPDTYRAKVEDIWQELRAVPN